MVEVKNVSKAYPTGIQANRNISLSVEEGKIVALIGPNGSGKTSLMQQMLGVLKGDCHHMIYQN
ncbi:MAG: ATP-binding cassette domain-containing protein [Clostridia bacterium]|nr:ATP-binding cassette domain-containing protein [Clostridia bacterium]